jgi:hypothetical protein
MLHFQIDHLAQKKIDNQMQHTSPFSQVYEKSSNLPMIEALWLLGASSLGMGLPVSATR